MSTSEKKPMPIPRPAPIEFAGQWVAWNKDRTEIVANGVDALEVHKSALEKGHSKAILQKVREPGISFIGAT
jgi:hypothetical protein